MAARTLTLSPTARNVLSTVVVLGLLVAVVGAAVFSAYTSVTSNDGNRFTAGTIDLTDDDGGSALFAVDGFTPGDTFSRCLRVNYASTGGVASDVRLYGGGSGDLADYLELRIRRGTMPAGGGSSASCSGFTPDAADYAGLGPGVIVDGPLISFPTTSAGAVADPAGGWADGDSAVYEISLHVRSDNDAMGRSVSQDFHFEARTR